LKIHHSVAFKPYILL